MRKMRNLEKSVPEEIEREVAANEEQESDLGRNLILVHKVVYQTIY